MTNTMTYGALAAHGKNAQHFLQGQLTNDINALRENEAQLTAHCNPQGRTINLFEVTLIKKTYYLVMPLDMLDITHNTLNKYAPVSKVTLEKSNAPATPLSTLTHKERINLRIPRLYPETSGKFLPHELNLDQLNAIQFDKGCYTGQEIIARIQFRGKVKNHLYCASLKTDKILQPGEDILTMINNTATSVGNAIDSCRSRDDELTALIIIPDQYKNDKTLFCKHRADHYFTIIE